MTVLAIIALALILIVLFAAWVHWASEGGILGFIMAWNILDTMGTVAHALIVLIASFGSNNDS